MALRAGWSGSFSRTAVFPDKVGPEKTGLLEDGFCVSAMLEVRLIHAPVKDAFAHDIVQAHGHKTEVNDHLPEAEQAMTGDGRELAIDDRPRHHEDRFNIEQDEQHGHHVEANTEAPAGIADRDNAAFVSGEFDRRISVSANEPRSYHHSEAEAK